MLITLLLEASRSNEKPNGQQIVNILPTDSALTTPTSEQVAVYFYDTPSLALTYRWMTILYVESETGWCLYADKIPSLFEEGPLSVRIKSKPNSSVPSYPPFSLSNALIGRINQETLGVVFTITKVSKQFYIHFQENTITVHTLQLRTHNYSSAIDHHIHNLIYLTTEQYALESVFARIKRKATEYNYRILAENSLTTHSVSSYFNEPIWQLTYRLWNDPLLVHCVEHGEPSSDPFDEERYLLHALESILEPSRESSERIFSSTPLIQKASLHRSKEHGHKRDQQPSDPHAGNHLNDGEQRQGNWDRSRLYLLRSALATAALVFLANDIGIVYDAEPEHLHRCRVSLRRIRSTLRLLEVADYDISLEFSLDTLRWYGKQLGAVRDLDVLIVRLQKDREAAGIEADKAFDQVLAPFENMREELVRSLYKARSSDRFPKLLDTMVYLATSFLQDEPSYVMSHASTTEEQEASSEDKAIREGPSRLPVQVEHVISDAWNELDHLARGLSANSSDKELHKLRIATKQLRYLLEACAPLTTIDMRRAIKSAVKLQDLLGEQHDSVITRSHLTKMTSPDDRYPSTVAIAHLLYLQEEKRDRLARKRWPGIFDDLRVAWRQIDL